MFLEICNSKRKMLITTPKVNSNKKVPMYRIVSEELAVAAVAVLPVLLVGRRRSAGAPLRAAVFILPLLYLRRRMAQRPISHFVPLTCLIPTKEKKGLILIYEKGFVF